MDNKRAVHLSKFLSLVLRHKPEAAHIELDAAGWVSVEHLIAGAARAGVQIAEAELREVVAMSDKQRFALSDDGCRIRANQGHSRPVDLGLTPSVPPAVLFHGTVEANVASILTNGLERRARQYVHLSQDLETARKVGGRRGKPVILKVDAAAMVAAGYAFICSDNGVWLVDAVPAHYVARYDAAHATLPTSGG